MAVAGETSWRTPRRASGSSEIEGCNTQSNLQRSGELRISLKVEARPQFASVGPLTPSILRAGCHSTPPLFSVCNRRGSARHRRRRCLPAIAGVWQSPRAARRLQTHMTPPIFSLASPGALHGPLTGVREEQAVLSSEAGVWQPAHARQLQTHRMPRGPRLTSPAVPPETSYRCAQAAARVDRLELTAGHQTTPARREAGLLHASSAGRHKSQPLSNCAKNLAVWAPYRTNQ